MLFFCLRGVVLQAKMSVGFFLDKVVMVLWLRQAQGVQRLVLRMILRGLVEFANL